MTPPTPPDGARTRHVPMRRCVACRTSRPKGELVRFTRTASGEWTLDADGRAGGRGAWLCRSCATADDARALRRFFKGQADAVRADLAALAAGSTANPNEDGRGATDGVPPNDRPQNPTGRRSQRTRAAPHEAAAAAATTED